MDNDLKQAYDSLPEPGEFRNHISSATLNQKLTQMATIDEFWRENHQNMIPYNLPIHLDKLLKQKKLKISQVARGAQLNDKYVYQIFNGDKNPSRDKLIALAFGLHLTAEETQTLLKLAEHRELYARDKRDSLILFSLIHNKNLAETNEALYDHGLTIL